MKKILITGGAGFIGSNFLQYMLTNHPDNFYINLDTLTYAGNLNNIERFNKYKNYKFIMGNICDNNIVDNIFHYEKPTYVVHFAAESHVSRSIQDSTIFIETNVLGTQILLKYALKYGIEKFLQVSTDEVYGQKLKGYFHEDDPPSPRNPYSVSKASADLLALSYFYVHKLPIVITRCCNNYGPYQFPEKLIPVIIVNSLQNQTIPIHGDGSHIREWIFVVDHCRAIVKVLLEGQNGEIYNIGTSYEKTNLKIIDTILNLMDKSDALKQFIKERLGDDVRYSMDFHKLRTELKWEPLVSFDEGIKQTIKWYCDNKQWWQDILSGQYLVKTINQYPGKLQ